MKKLSLVLAIAASIISSVSFASSMEGKLKDGTMVKLDEHSKLWLVKNGKTESAADGMYDVWNDGKEVKVEVKDGKASVK